jgi:hypothetical protein
MKLLFIALTPLASSLILCLTAQTVVAKAPGLAVEEGISGEYGREIKIRAYSAQQPGFWLLRVERDGVDLSDGIDISAGAQLTGVRVFFAYVTGVIRGQAPALNYELPHNLRLQILARRVGYESAAGVLITQTDDRGRFIFEGMAPGEYELSSGAIVITGSDIPPPSLSGAKQKVVVSNGKESAVTLVLKLSER